jgi:signal transduction histidine kinase
MVDLLPKETFMQAIADRLLVLICCAALLPGQAYDTTAVVAMLAAMTVSALNGYTRSRSFLIASVVSYTVASMAWPAFCLFTPLVLYDALTYSHITGQGLWTLAAVGSLVCFANLSIPTALIIAALTAVAYVLAMRTTAIERSQTKAKQLRDSGYEMAMLLRKQNQDLIEKQDYELRLATLSERGRIAREIHDHVGHLLSRSILQVGALMFSRISEEEKQSLSVIRDTLSQAMDSIRTSVHDLHDESFDFRIRTEALVQEFTFCPIRLDYRLEHEPERDIAYCFIAIVKEGLNNIIRHSDATQVTLALLEHPALYQLVLRDNGSQSTSESGEGLGLRSIADRVDALDGQFVVERDDGFRLFISVPKGRQLHESAHSR